MPNTIKVHMDWIKSTKNTEVYAASEDNAPVTQVYIQKSAWVEGGAPEEIILTIEEK